MVMLKLKRPHQEKGLAANAGSQPEPGEAADAGPLRNPLTTDPAEERSQQKPKKRQNC